MGDAPEQREHHRTDHRADIYSLGVVLHELLIGELPAEKLQPPSRKVQIDVRLDEIVLRALEVKPELRCQTAAEFRTQVETIAQHGAPAGKPTSAAPTPMGIAKPGYHPWLRLLRNVAIFIAIMVLGMCSVWRAAKAPTEHASASAPLPQQSAATGGGEPAPTQLTAT